MRKVTYLFVLLQCLFMLGVASVHAKDDPTITVIAPNGHERLPILTHYDIKWSASSDFSDSFKIEYSLYGGHDGPIWSEVARVGNEVNNYDWMVPNYLSPTCLVKVSGVNFGEPYDSSDDYFVITGPNGYSCGDANGDDRVNVADVIYIWNYLFESGPPPVDYLKNPLLATGDVDSIYGVTIGDEGFLSGYLFLGGPHPNCPPFPPDPPPPVQSGDSLIIGSTMVLPESSHITIPIMLKNVSPMRAISIPLHFDCSTSSITCDAIDLTGSRMSEWNPKSATIDNSNKTILIGGMGLNGSINPGYGLIANAYFTVTPSPNAQFVSISPTFILPNNNLVLVKDLGGGGTQMLRPWLIVPGTSPIITVTSPNGGENWTVGSVHNITWTSENFTGNVKIEYSTDGGEWITIFASIPNDGNESWTIPNAPSTDVLVKVSGADTGSPSDESNNPFTIQVITVTSPNGGETWRTDSTYNITWSSAGTIDNVKIEYSTDGGDHWYTISDNTPNTGTKPWTVPNKPSTDALVKVSDVVTGAFDVSNDPFTITNQLITVTSPNGGEHWLIGTPHDILWTCQNFTGNVNIEYSTDAGAHWNSIVDDTLNTGTKSWTISSTPTAQGRVRVSAVTGTPTDMSDSNFTMYKEGYKCGDANADDRVTAADVIYIWNYLFKRGPEPVPVAAGDVDLIDGVTISDDCFLNRYLFLSGPPPYCPPFDAVPPEQSDDNILRMIDSGMVLPGAVHITIPIMLQNASSMRAISIPLRFYYPLGITCDAVSLTGSRMSDWTLKSATIDTLHRTILIGGIALGADQPMNSGSGLIATAYFTVESSPDTELVLIDTVFIPPNNNLLLMRDLGGGSSRMLVPKVEGFASGDANGDGHPDVADVIYVINYLFRGGPAPGSADVNCDHKVSVSDVIYTINYLFKGGPPPC